MLQTAQMQNHQNKIRNKIKVSPLDYRSKCCPKIINRNNCNNRWMSNNSKCRATKIEKEVQIRKVKNRFKLLMRRFQTLLESRWNSCNNLRRVKLVIFMVHLWAAKKTTPHRTQIVMTGIQRLVELQVAVLLRIWGVIVGKFTKMEFGSLRHLQYLQFTKLIFSSITSPNGLFIFIRDRKTCWRIFALSYLATR